MTEASIPWRNGAALSPRENDSLFSTLVHLRMGLVLVNVDAIFFPLCPFPHNMHLLHCIHYQSFALPLCLIPGLLPPFLHPLFSPIMPIHLPAPDYPFAHLFQYSSLVPRLPSVPYFWPSAAIFPSLFPPHHQHHAHPSSCPVSSFCAPTRVAFQASV